MRIAILTISDSRHKGEKQDENKAIIEDLLARIGAETVFYEIVPDDASVIRPTLIHAADDLGADIVLTNGSTGFSERDVAPETTREVVEREVPGIPEAMRFEGFKKTKRAILSRAVAGIRGKTIIINLPGSPLGVRQSLGAIVEVLPHALEMLAGGGHESESEPAET
jgi:molybdopterin adenylyltransferase